MNCFDCAEAEWLTPAVAVCHDCGAAVCADHAVSFARHLTRTATINRVIVVEPPARLIRCRVCATANDAAHQDRPRHRERGRHLAARR